MDSSNTHNAKKKQKTNKAKLEYNKQYYQTHKGNWNRYKQNRVNRIIEQITSNRKEGAQE